MACTSVKLAAWAASTTAIRAALGSSRHVAIGGITVTDRWHRRSQLPPHGMPAFRLLWKGWEGPIGREDVQQLRQWTGTAEEARASAAGVAGSRRATWRIGAEVAPRVRTTAADRSTRTAARARLRSLADDESKLGRRMASEGRGRWWGPPLEKTRGQMAACFAAKAEAGRSGTTIQASDKQGPLRAPASSIESSRGRRLLYSALLVDVGGTLLETAEPVELTYARIGAKYGVSVSPAEIRQGFRKAFSRPWDQRLRYEGDGRPFWRHAVALATGSSDLDLFEELYQHYANGDAWKIADGASDALSRLRDGGVKLGVASNFDNRLRPLLQHLGIHDVFDAVIVSAEVGHEKPSPEFFSKALECLEIDDPSTVVHVGDEAIADQKGATDAGIDCWLWKKDVSSFSEIAHRILRPEDEPPAAVRTSPER